MSYPTAYDPSVNFASEESASTAGRSTVRTTALDAEFAALSTRIGQIISCITAITRSDAALLDGIVTIASLSTACQAYLTAAGGSIKGTWLTATSYVAKDVVVNGTGTYICASAHTSGVFATDLAAVKWVKLYDVSSFAASGVTFTPTGGISAANVQAALAELDSEAAKKASNLSDLADRATAFANLVASGGTLTGALTLSGARINEAQGANIASAATIDLDSATGNLVDVTGTTTITGVTLTQGREAVVRFTGTLTLTHSANLVLPGAANIVTAAGDFAVLRGYSAGIVRCVVYTRTSGQVLVPSPEFPTISASVAGNALTVTLGAGVPLQFSDGTSLVSSAATLTVSSGSTLGTSNGVAARLWVVAMKNGGTPELAIINTWNGTDVYEILSTDTISTTAEGGAGAADSAHTWYSTTLRSTQPIAILGYVEITEATAGTWATAPTLSQAWGPGVPLPGQRVQRRRNTTSALATGSTTIPYDDTIPQNTEGDQYASQAITPRSALNILLIEASMNIASSATGKMTSALFQDATANALAAICDGSDTANNPNVSKIEYQMVAGTTSATTFKIRAGLDAAGTTTLNGNAGARRFGGVATSWMSVTEVMR